MIDTAIILAGGRGERLMPLTKNLPKPMVEVQGRPILYYIITNLKKAGIKEIHLAIGYEYRKIMNYVLNELEFDGLKILFTIEEEFLGTGGAVKNIINSKKIKKSFMLIWGDNLADYDFNRFKTYDGLNDIVMMGVRRNDVENFGVLELEESSNTIKGFVEKPKREDAPSNIINAGAFIISPKVFDGLAISKFSIEKDIFEPLAEKGKISVVIHNGQWFPADTLEKLKFAQLNFVQK